MNAKEMKDLQIRTLQPRILAVISQIIEDIQSEVKTGNSRGFKTFNIKNGTELELLLSYVVLELKLLGYKTHVRLTGCDENGWRTGCELEVSWFFKHPTVHG
jgi:hypothetical protein